MKRIGKFVLALILVNVLLFAISIPVKAFTEGMACPCVPFICTRCAPKYSEAAFLRITPGMTVQQVENLIGQPLSKREWGGGATELIYTDQGGLLPLVKFAWMRRAVYVDRKGVVVSVSAGPVQS